MGYMALFLAPETISTARDPRYTVIWKSTKLVNFVISGHFHGLSHTVFGSGDDLTARDPRHTVISKSTKLVNFVISGRFRGL